MSADATFQIDSAGALLRTALPLPGHSGKVRDVYDLGDKLMIVSTDRISAFDWILPSGIPGKGRLLTEMSRFWFNRLMVDHHLISTEIPDGVLPREIDPALLIGRTMIVRKAQVVPFECVVRGYLEGSGLREYQQLGAICGVPLPPGLQQCDRLPEPIFTPATKAPHGHDENVSFQQMAADIGQPLAEQLRSRSLEIYKAAAEYAMQRGIIIADTKFEFGLLDESLILVDEVLTPDSSRFWAADHYHPGAPQPSFDKQFVRQWLAQTQWDRNSPPPPLPPDIVARTQEKYQEACFRLTGQRL